MCCMRCLSAVCALQRPCRLPGQATQSSLTYTCVNGIASGRHLLGATEHHYPCMQSRFMLRRQNPVLQANKLNESGSMICKPARDKRALSVGRLHCRTFASETDKRRLGCRCKLPAMSRLQTADLERPTPVPTTVPLAPDTFVSIPRLSLSADCRCPASKSSSNVEEARNHSFQLSWALTEKSHRRNPANLNTLDWEYVCESCYDVEAVVKSRSF